MEEEILLIYEGIRAQFPALKRDKHIIVQTIIPREHRYKTSLIKSSKPSTHMQIYSMYTNVYNTHLHPIIIFILI